MVVSISPSTTPAAQQLFISALELSYIPSTNLVIQRTLRGSNQAYGRLIVTIQNLQSDTVGLLYLETMPWFVQFYLHTLKIHVDDLLRSEC
jgi:GPI-anchor transamidase subunit T